MGAALHENDESGFEPVGAEERSYGTGVQLNATRFCMSHPVFCVTRVTVN